MRKVSLEYIFSILSNESDVLKYSKHMICKFSGYLGQRMQRTLQKMLIIQYRWIFFSPCAPRLSE